MPGSNESKDLSETQILEWPSYTDADEQCTIVGIPHPQ